jgi:phage head maturation protease
MVMSKEFKISTDLHIVRFADDKSRWIIEGIATTADLDVDGLYISEEALVGAENDLKKYTTLLYNHDRDKEIGKILEVKYQPEQRALWIKALISKTVPDIWQKINEEVLNKFSVSGTALDFKEKFVKGLDQAVKYVTQMRLFETSLVTVPADASARALAYYVEKSMKTNKESKMAIKKKTDKIVKSQDAEKVEAKTDEVVERDAKAIDLMVSAVEDALRSEEREVQVNTLRSVLDFLKAEQATKGSEDVAKSLSLEDIVKAVDGVFESRFNDIKETVVALAETSKEVVEKSAEEKTDKIIEKGKEEDVKVDIEKSAEKVEKTEVPAEDNRVEKLERSIEALTEIIKTNMPIRKGLGAEDHKEDNRGEKAEDGDITKSAEYQKLSPLDKLKALHEYSEKLANDK